MNTGIVKNHPNIWKFIRFLQTEEKRVQIIWAQWNVGASKKINPRTNLKTDVSTIFIRDTKMVSSTHQSY